MNNNPPQSLVDIDKSINNNFQLLE